jgi:hypothetical protein
MKKNARTYLIGALGPVLLMIPGFIFLNYAFIFMAAMVFVMGATFIVLPYSTSDTVKIYGVEGSIRFTRACGIIFMLFGVLLLFMHTVLM